MPRIAVIVPTYRRPAALCDTLRSVLAQEWPDLEIVVVDQTPEVDASVRALIQEHAGRIVYHRQEEPNLPKARNTGVGLTTADAVIFIDDDVVLPPGFIAAHVKRLYLSDDVGAVTGPTVDSLAPALDEMMPDFRKVYGWPDVPPESDCFSATWVAGGNVSIKRQALDKAGPFDESFTGSAFCEDVDAGIRIREGGYRLLFDRDAWLVHLALPMGGCETRNPVDAVARERERFQHLVYCRLKHARFEGFYKTAGLVYRAFRTFALNRPAIARGPAYFLARLRTAAAETRQAYRRVTVPPASSARR